MLMEIDVCVDFCFQAPPLIYGVRGMSFRLLNRKDKGWDLHRSTFPSNSKPPPNMCCSSDMRHLFCIFLLSCPHLATAFFLMATNLWSLKQGRRICDLVGDRIRYDLGDTQGCGIRMPFLSILGSDPWKTTRVAKKGHANLRSM